MQKKITALLLRGSSMGAKFLLMIGLSKVLSTSDYGVISLIVTTITFFVFLLGFDFYNYSHRELIENKTNQQSFLLNQFWFHTIGYIVFIPIVYLIFLKEIIPFEYLFPFYILLILEHLSQEIFRFFNLFNKQNLANLTLFIRTAFWILIMVFVEYFLLKNEINIEKILYYWIGGSVLSLLFSAGFLIISRKKMLQNVVWFSIDKKWIKKGISVSFPFFIGTVAYKIIEYSDRYMIDWYLGKESVGIYSFYTNFANIVNIVVNTITITLIVPNLLRAVNSNDPDQIKNMISKFSKELYITVILISILIAIMIYPTLHWLDKEDFSLQLPVYFVVLVGNIMLNFSLLFHFLLYSYKKDKQILKPALFAAILNVILNMIFIPIFGILAAAISTLISFGLILFLKRFYWHNFKKKTIEYKN
ncbi:oligosaccharide flippase family protein [Aquimarina sp. 2201CG5-10]|uniref:oligosaccharide flippase family protein n=1 Tax=Aquimarina callyspongiae TaxID=3098150 RepID=UPI002AB3E7B2|nr:oligosaccharide flippase family protein [Aquimarina sp. 2201CG5-10]MDY8138680.1 oligosaccharide flippase family protein [Aquimarina sp. 2201CG5-10]